MDTVKNDAQKIIEYSLAKVLPDAAVKKALTGKAFSNGNIYVVSVGKAAWQMAKTAEEILGERLKEGIVITKYGCVKHPLHKISCYEAGHPVPDKKSFESTQRVLNMVSNLNSKDTVVFLLSGGGSALFEKPLIEINEITDITNQLLACGADIMEINTIRKRLSGVKGGRFAKICEPASVYSIVLSDILGDPLDMIASGPACADSTTCKQAQEIIKKYHLHISEQAKEMLETETPKEITNTETHITGSVRDLCFAAKEAAERLGYKTTVLTDQLDCEAAEAGRFLGAIAKSYQNAKESMAFIAGGETVVHLRGKGKGGRNQELALAAAEKIDGLYQTAVFSVGSDGTDGPTDAAGGYCDENTKAILQSKGISIFNVLQENNAYYALKMANGLIMTGATGTNVNDVAVLLIKR